MLYYATLYGENQVFCCTNCVFFMFFSCILNIFVQVVAFIKFFCKSLFIFAHKKCGRSFVLHHGNEVNYSAAAKLPKISSGMFSSASPTSLLATWNVTARTVSSSRKVYSASTVSPGVYIRQ